MAAVSISVSVLGRKRMLFVRVLLVLKQKRFVTFGKGNTGMSYPSPTLMSANLESPIALVQPLG